MKDSLRFAILLSAVVGLLLALSCASFGVYPCAHIAGDQVRAGTVPAGTVAPDAAVPRVAGTLESLRMPGGVTQPTADYAPGEIIVKFKTKPRLDESRLSDPEYLASTPDLKAITARHKLRRMESVFGEPDAEKAKRRFHQRARRARGGATPPDLAGIFKIALEDSKANVLDICAELRKNPDIEFAEPNYVARIQMVPNDPYYSSSGSWGQGYDDLWGIKKINCAPAWDTALGDGVVVAVIDTGLDYNHEDIAANVWANSAEDINANGKFDNWPSTEQQGGVYGDLDGIDNDANGKVDDVMGWDFCTYGGNVPDNNPIDDNGHGTHVSGTIAAVGNNGIGVIGVAPHAKIMPVRGLNYQGSGYTDDLAGCLTYAADNGADVLNNSWIVATQEPINAIQLAVAYANSLGCVTVAAAGNNAHEIGPARWQDVPASLTGVVAVAATDMADQKTSFTNYGAYVDVCAPGVGILSLRAANTDLYQGSSGYTPGQNFVPAFEPNAKYYRANGTSMSCPHVSGEAALIIAAHPDFSNSQVERVIMNTAQISMTWDTYIGTGRVNAANALQVTSVTDASVSISSPTESQYIHDGSQVVGTATGTSYAVEMGLGIYPSSWTQIGWGGPTSNDVLAVFHTAAVEDGHYTFRLRSEDAVETVRCYYDSLLLPGFPRRALGNPDSKIIVADLDNDGEDEIVSLTMNGVDVLGEDGSEYPGFPLCPTSDGYKGLWCQCPPAVGDVTGDSRKEIVVVGSYVPYYQGPCHMQSQLISSTGSVMWRFDVADEYNWPGMPQPMLVDRDLDGKNEIVVAWLGAANSPKQYQSFVYMLSGSGTTIWRTVLAGRVCHSAVGDINGDGAKEIVLGLDWDSNGDNTYDMGKLVVLDINGSVLLQPALANPGIGSGALALADINNDGNAEILYAPWTYPAGGRVYAFNGQGTQLWASGQMANTIFAISAGDVNSDGLVELVVRSYGPSDYRSNNQVYIVGSNGSIIRNWQDVRKGGVSATHSPIALIADMDGNGSPDIITQGYAWDITGSVIGNFPRLTYGQAWTWNNAMANNPAIAHLSGNGGLNLCGSADTGWSVSDVFAWELPVQFNRQMLEWPLPYHDPHNTNCYVSPSLDTAGGKLLSDGAFVRLHGTVVTASFGDCFYVEADDRCAGIRIRKAEHGRSLGERVDVWGTLRTDDHDGERYIDATTIAQTGVGNIAPLGLNNSAIGGSDWSYDPSTGAGQQGITDASGLNNIGILVRTFGWVTEVEGVVEPTWFKIDDGSGVNVKCVVPTGVTVPANGAYVCVTGISSCEKPGADILRLLRIREQADIQVLKAP